MIVRELIRELELRDQDAEVEFFDGDQVECLHDSERTLLDGSSYQVVTFSTDNMIQVRIQA